MSFLTGTNCELIYVNNSAGTAKNTFTSEALINDTAGMGPQPCLPQGFFYGSSRKSLKIVARAAVGATTTAPTWTLVFRAGGNAAITGPIIGQSSAVTGLASTTILLKAELDIVVGDSAGYTIGTGATTVRGTGDIICPRGSSNQLGEVWGGNASPGTVTTFDPSVTNYINVSAICGTSNASNQIQLVQLLIYGLN
jgi:hypothetical protein